MTRRLRLHVPGGFYHVTLRGNHRQPVFFRAADRDLLDECVSHACMRLGARVHAYCWMTNHIHLLVQIADAPLGKVILQIASRYARTVQLRIQTTGHLFERRYHAVLVDADSYLLTLIRYIHLNPVNAGVTDDPAAYPWSSHLVYLGSVARPWVSTGFAMSLLASDPARAVARYLELIGRGDPLEWGTGPLTTNPDRADVLGDDDFITRMGIVPRRTERRISLNELVRECAAQFDVSFDSMVSRSRSPNLVAARAWLGHEAISREISSVSAIARLLKRTEGSLRHLMRRYPRAVREI